MLVDLTDLAQLKALLKKYGLWAKKRLGQNFLVDRDVLDAIIAAADLQPDDLIVEIGPGPGVLTRELLPLAKRVITVEIDGSILPVLKETTAFFRDKLEIVHGHVLDFRVPDQPYKVVANIPYYLTSPILRHFLLESEHRPRSLTMLVQKEVAERIADPQHSSVLSLIVAVAGTAKIVAIVPPHSFFPPPKVSSAIIQITVGEEPRINVPIKPFLRMVKMGFGAPRKKLKNNLPSELLAAAGINPDLRPENLALADWEKLTLTAIAQAKK